MDEQDTQLIRRCLSGEASAVEALYGAHAGRIVAYFLRSGFARADLTCGGLTDNVSNRQTTRGPA